MDMVNFSGVSHRYRDGSLCGTFYLAEYGADDEVECFDDQLDVWFTRWVESSVIVTVVRDELSSQRFGR